MPFAGNAGADDAGGDAAAADASVTDAIATPDEGRSDAAAPVDASDASPSDGGAQGVCNNVTAKIQCFDFDEPSPTAGLTLSQGGGTVTIGPSFVGGSAPTRSWSSPTSPAGRRAPAPA